MGEIAVKESNIILKQMPNAIIKKLLKLDFTLWLEMAYVMMRQISLGVIMMVETVVNTNLIKTFVLSANAMMKSYVQIIFILWLEMEYVMMKQT